MSISPPDRDVLIYREMMSHTPLFAHRNPKKIALWDDTDRGITQEILKHQTVAHIWQPGITQSTDPRIKFFEGPINDFLIQTDKNSLDVLIIASPMELDFHHCTHALNTDGIFIQVCESFFDLNALKNLQQQLKSAGFTDILPLNFGWRAAVMAVKEGTIKSPREKDIYNKPFATSYYNLDMHKAAFALPEFMREELNC